MIQRHRHIEQTAGSDGQTRRPGHAGLGGLRGDSVAGQIGLPKHGGGRGIGRGAIFHDARIVEIRDVERALRVEGQSGRCG